MLGFIGILAFALLRCVQYHPVHPFTFRTEFISPNGLGTVSVARGSGIHSPSTTNRYSYSPGRNTSSLTQRPAPSKTMGETSGRQSLNVPAIATAFAVGWLNST